MYFAFTNEISCIVITIYFIQVESMDIDIFIALQDYLYVIDFISHVTLNIKI